MTPFREIADTIPGEIIRSLSLLIMVGLLDLSIRIFRSRESKNNKFYHNTYKYICMMAVWSVWMYAMLSFTDRYKVGVGIKPETFILTAVWDAPWLVSVLAELVFALILLIQEKRIRNILRKSILPASIKEAVDMLPSGICFGDEDGTVVFSNLKMNAICRRISGGNLLDYYDFSRILTEKGKTRNGKTLVVQENGNALLFMHSEAAVAEKQYHQLFSSDVSALYKITSDLSRKNGKLRDIQLRMKAYQAQASAIVISKEIMKARAIVHDELGHVLLSAAYYMDHPDKVEASALLKMLKQTNQLLLNAVEEPDDMEHDRFQEAMNVVNAIGVRVELDGDVPASGRARELLGQTIRECAFNAVKHADADTLTVQITQSADAFTVSLTNNGTAPDEEIIETGGLLTLRRTVEEIGGTMTVSAAPEFRLTLNIPPDNTHEISRK